MNKIEIMTSVGFSFHILRIIHEITPFPVYPSNFASERTEQHPKWNKTHIKVPDVEQKSPRQFLFFFTMAQQPPVGQGLLTVQDS
jgi:hypothetical protein